MKRIFYILLILIIFGTSFFIIDIWEQSLLIKKSEMSQRYQEIKKQSQIYSNLRKNDNTVAPALKTELKIFIQNSLESLSLKEKLESIELINNNSDVAKVSLIKLKKEDINDILNLLGDKYSNVVINKVSINKRQDISEQSDIMIYLEKL